jgi:hypothetical protein
MLFIYQKGLAMLGQDPAQFFYFCEIVYFNISTTCSGVVALAMADPSTSFNRTA